MGYSPDTLDDMVRLCREIGVGPGCRVAELGAQQLYCKGGERKLIDFIKHFNPGFVVDEDEMRELSDMGLAGQMFRDAGFDYDSFDVNDALGTVRFDLNTDSVGDAHRHRYDLVTNFGTTEHVFNQLNAFRVMHDLTKEGGHMWHSVPLSGMVDHSLFSYHPKFFHHLAKNNFYDIVEVEVIALSEDIKGFPDFHQHLKGAEHFSARDNFFQVVFRKPDSLPFMPAIDHLECDSDGETLRYMIGNILNYFFSPGELEKNRHSIAQYVELLMREHGHPSPDDPASRPASADH